MKSDERELGNRQWRSWSLLWK